MVILRPPDAFAERIIPFRFHRLEITERDGVLNIFKKKSWRPDGEIVDLFEYKTKNKHFINLMKRHPSPFYTRYYWSENIHYNILNPSVTADWLIPDSNNDDYVGREKSIRKVITSLLRWLFSQNSRNKDINIASLLRLHSLLFGKYY